MAQWDPHVCQGLVSCVQHHYERLEDCCEGEVHQWSRAPFQEVLVTSHAGESWEYQVEHCVLRICNAPLPLVSHRSPPSALNLCHLLSLPRTQPAVEKYKNASASFGCGVKQDIVHWSSQLMTAGVTVDHGT